MTQWIRETRYPALVALMVGVASLGACGGGGGGGSGGTEGDGSFVLSITAQGVPSPLWQHPAITPPSPPTNVPINAPIIFTFSGPVDPASLPAQGPAVGAISITIPGTQTTPPIPAFGGFSVVDEPGLPAGNQRRVVFSPVPPTDPLNPSSAGFQGGGGYTVFVPRSGSSPQVVNVSGAPIANEAVTAFVVCNPPPGNTLVCFTDPVPGNPFIVQTFPPSGATAPAPINPNSLVPGNPLNPFATVPNTVTAFISEPVFPQNIDLANVRLINTVSGAQVPGMVRFFQAGSAQALPDQARIDYEAASPLLSGVTYRLDFSANVRDFGSNPVEEIQGMPGADRVFATVVLPFCQQPDIVEPFDNTNRLATTSTPAVVIWGNTGLVETEFPIDIVGDSSFGPLTIGAGSQVIDTGMPQGPGYSNGVWNLTNLSFASGAMIRLTGSFPAHFRCTGSATIAANVNGSAGTSPLAPPGSPDQGPRVGTPDQGATTGGVSVILGGVGGVGAGRGGNGSPDGTARSPKGEDGFGPFLNGMPSSGSPPVPSYGGGQGGVGGFFPPPATNPGELGGLGGAGGSAWADGGSPLPQDQTMGCTPIATPQQTAMATGFTQPFVGPVLALSAGSGGGGGGDRYDNIVPTNDDQGGGAGGGGGGFRVSAIGPITINAGAIISMNGANGANGATFAGAGGAGSGGMIWMQSFSPVTINPTSGMTVNGGMAAQACTRNVSGAGGAGLFQFESGAGTVTAVFAGSGAQGGMNIFLPPFPFSTSITGEVTSVFIDTGYGDPEYTSATLATDPVVNTTGVPPGTTVEILYEAAFESLTEPNQPDLSTILGPVPGENITALNGRRFVRFTVRVSYPPPPTTTLSSPLPTIDEVRIRYRAPIGCP